MHDREVLLKRVQTCDFVLYDTALYLDTHPDDQAALAYYKKHMALRDQAKKEYMENYGPLCHNDFTGGDRWTWVDGPWPWQNEEA